MKTQEINCIVGGRVQMVMYRDFCKRTASKLGVVGEVCNLQDGTVKIIAQADKGVLKNFIERLKHGSALASVKSVKVEWGEPKQTYKKFSIVYN